MWEKNFALYFLFVCYHHVQGTRGWPRDEDSKFLEMLVPISHSRWHHISGNLSLFSFSELDSYSVCCRYLMKNPDWLEEQLGDVDDDYILFDCPGQIELYTHMTIMRQLVELLQQRWNFRVCGVFLVDSQFMVDGSKFLSGTMAALSAMVNLELPHINILTKMDLLSKSARNQIDRLVRSNSDIQQRAGFYHINILNVS